MGVTPFLKTVGSAELSLAPVPRHTLRGTGASHDVSEELKGLRRPRIVSSGSVRDRQDTRPYSVSFSVCPPSAVGIHTSAIGEGQLLKQTWKVDTRSDRQMPAGSTQFRNLAVARLIEASPKHDPHHEHPPNQFFVSHLGKRSLRFFLALASSWINDDGITFSYLILTHPHTHPSIR